MGAKETNIGNEICIALSKRGCKIFRSQSGHFYTKYGAEIIIGVVGESDYHGHTPQGKAFYIETKTKTGRASKEQKRFLRAMYESTTIRQYGPVPAVETMQSPGVLQYLQTGAKV